MKTIFYFEYSNLEMHAGDLPIFSIREIRERHGPIRIASPFIEIKGFVGMHDLQPEPRSAQWTAISSLDMFQREPADRTCLPTLRYRMGRQKSDCQGQLRSKRSNSNSYSYHRTMQSGLVPKERPLI